MKLKTKKLAMKTFIIALLLIGNLYTIQAQEALADNTMATSEFDKNSPVGRLIREAHRLVGLLSKYDDAEMQMTTKRIGPKLSKIKMNIGKIKSQLPSYSKIAGLEKNHKILLARTKVSNNKMKNKVEIVTKISDTRRNLVNDIIQNKYDDDWGNKVLTYSEFQKVKADFKKSIAELKTYKDESANAGYEKVIIRNEELYKNVSTRWIPKINEQIDYILNDINKGWKTNGAERGINSLKYFLKNWNRVKNHFTYNAATIADWQKVKNQCEKELDKLETYMKPGGAYDAYKIAYAKQIIEDRRVGSSRMNLTEKNKTLITKNIIKVKPLYKEGGTQQTGNNKVLRIVMSSGWYIIRHDISGLPLRQFSEYRAAIKDKNGKCWVANGRLHKTYLGGGTWSSVSAEYRYSQKMNCANVNK